MKRSFAAVIAGISIISVVGQTAIEPSSAQPSKRLRNPPVVGQVRVDGKPVAAAKESMAQQLNAKVRPASAHAIAWPSGSAIADAVDGAVAGKGSTAGLTRAGRLPVWIGSASAGRAARLNLKVPSGAGTGRPTQVGKSQVKIASQTVTEQLGITGVVLDVRPTAASTEAKTTQSGDSAAPLPITVQLDYSQFGLVGGDWASRARLVQLPACALTTPGKRICQSQTPLPTVNDASAKTLTAISPTRNNQALVMAASAGVSGDSGSFAATSLSPSGQWSAGGSSGDFTYGYPMRVPGVAGGLEPSLSLGYSSQSVDGRTTSTNNQPSWVGEGWDLSQGFVERSYEACSDDMGGDANNTAKTGDLCWAGDGISVSLAGHSGQLIRNGSSDEYRLRTDDGTRFEKITSPFTNGDDDREAWKATTPDGTQYFFGRGKNTDGGTDTNSAWTVPVFGNNPGEPCHDSSYASSYCQQAWRWNLDAVIDTDGNQMSLYYTAETNNYGRNGNSDVSSYNPGGYLNRIDYGQRSDAATGTAPARVAFTVAERCLPASGQDCTNLTASSAPAWPDVPQDQLCTSTTSCPGQRSPAFFTRKRLTQIQTQIWSGSAYSEVERWSLTQSFPDPGDGTTAGLWLQSVQHAAKGGANPMPATTFSGDQMDNRVDGIEDTPGHTAPPMIKYRIRAVVSETGQETLITYSDQDCTPTSLPSETNNARRCYPAYFQPEGASQPYKHWFHKYVVNSVAENDLSGGSAYQVKTSYTYSNPGWRYDDLSVQPDNRRTWSLWSGYGKVKTIVGDPASATSLRSDVLYYQGLDGNRANASGGASSVSVTDSEGVSVADKRAFQGQARESITFNGPTGAEVSGSISDRSVVATTASSGGRQAEISGVTRLRSRTTLESGGPRRTETLSSYDGFGYATEVDDLGDTSTAADDRCTRTTYARDTSRWILAPVATSRARATRCAAWPANPTTEQVLTDSRTYYDNLALGQVDIGRPTKTETANGIDGGGAVTYGTTSTTSYDGIGRPTSVTDALGRTATTAYTPAGAGLVTGSSVSTPDPDGTGPTTPLTTVATFDPQWNVPTKTTSPSGAVSTITYDTYGRPTAAWAIGHTQTAFPSTPSLKYSYAVRNNGPSAITTDSLNWDNSYVRSVDLYDGLGRARQTQTQTTDQAISSSGTVTQTTGRLIADTLYDARGLTIDSRGPTFASGAPATTYTNIIEAQAVTQTTAAYDGAGRMTKQTLRALGADKWSTSYSYGGDRTTVTPPAGGTPSTTVFDADGQTTALRQYKAATPTGAYDESTYGYTPAGQLKTMTDVAGNDWRYSYDIRGQQVKSEDPDAGTTTQTFDDAGQLLTTTNARNQTLGYTYDNLGRPTSLRDGSPSGTIRASWTYDTVRKGYLSSNARTVGSGANTGTITNQVTAYDEAGNPTASQTVVPAITGWIESALASTYKTTATYNPDNSVKTATLGGRGNIPAEQFKYTYDNIGRPIAICGGGCYVAGSVYSAYGPLLQINTGSVSPNASWTTSVYDNATGRMTRRYFDRESVTKSDVDISYSYTNSGALTKVNSTFPQTAAAADTQCFSRDYLQRLTSAWTPKTGDCTAAKSVAALGGPAPFWQDWTFDAASNRTSEINHASAGDTVTTWAHPTMGTARPHGATSQTVTAPGKSAVTTGLGYDADGNVTSRSLTAGSIPARTGYAATAAANQTLSYDSEGSLVGTTTTPTPSGSGISTQWAYDADGEPLVRRDNTTTSLYVGDTTIDLNRSTNALTSSQTINFGGEAVAVRTGPNTADVTTLWSDLNNTANWQVNNSNAVLTTRRTLPYGTPRGSQGTLKGPNGFVDGINDPLNGLVRIGARDYDPATGRFLSPDPLLDITHPVQWNAYSYGGGNPIDQPDPSGLMMPNPDGGNQVPEIGAAPSHHNEVDTMHLVGASSSGGGHSSSPHGGGGWHHYGGGYTGTSQGGGHPSRGGGWHRPTPYVAPPTLTHAWRAQSFAGYGGFSNPLVADIGTGMCSQGVYVPCSGPQVTATPGKPSDAIDIWIGLAGVIPGIEVLAGGLKALRLGKAAKAANVAEEEARAAKAVSEGLEAAPSVSEVAYGPAPEKVWKTLERAQEKGSPLPGYKGGRPWANDGRQESQILPRTTKDGTPITYKEWDVNPFTKGVYRGEERLVTGSDGRSYYTESHYKQFTQFDGPGR